MIGIALGAAIGERSVKVSLMDGLRGPFETELDAWRYIIPQLGERFEWLPVYIGDDA